MSFPGEELIASAIDNVTNAALHKLDVAEAQRNREFAYSIKELEYYKGNYDKELKNTFENWFGFLENLIVATSNNASDEIKRQKQKRIDETLKFENAIKLKINTMKYGGTETGKALALFSKVSHEYKRTKSVPSFAMIYVICKLLSVLKRDILGQDITPLTMLKILLIDYDEYSDVINDSRAYVENIFIKMFEDEAEI